jgi:hypothetical protein
MRGAPEPVLSVEESVKTETRIFDPFGQGTDLAHTANFHPLGFPLQLATNSADVLTAARENWSGFIPYFDVPPLRLHVVVDEENPGPCPTSLNFRAQRYLLTVISDPSNFAVCDLERGFASCWFTRATASNREWLRYFYLDTVAYLILWHQHLTRIHASCVARNGRGVLLCGPSGAGKSCLAYACTRRGWTFISDEATSLMRRTSERVVLGNPRRMRFRETVTDVLPELGGRASAPNPIGKITIEVPTGDLPGIITAFQCRAAAVVFLNRHTGGPARLEPLSPEEGWCRLERDLPLFDHSVHVEHRASLKRLLETGVYELHYCDLDPAVELLEELVR